MRRDEAPTAVEFGRYQLLPKRRELHAGGERVRLGSRAFDVLMVLTEARGALVTKDEILARVWPGTVVEENNLVVQIATLRKALGEDRDFIRTEPGRGYRFMAEVRSPGSEAEAQIGPDAATIGAAPDEPAGPASDGPARPAASDLGDLADAGGSSPRLPVRSIYAFGFGLIVIAALSFWVLYSHSSGSSIIRSLAVLPLQNLSTDPSEDYFADGMTDELITGLGQISALRVISRTSVMTYKGVRKPLPQIARELDVDAIVEGTVLRSGDRVRITAQLIQVPADKHLWAHSYEENLRDTLALQNRVARAIAEQIRVTLNRKEQAALESAKVVNPEAYEAYLKGRYFWNRRTGDGLKKAIDYFNLAIAKDPNYAEAYTGLADAYALSGDWEYGILSPDDAFPKAKVAADQAVTLDDSLAEAHTSLAFVLDLYDWDWAAAETEYKRAIALNPGYATAHHWYAWHLIVTGRSTEGIAELKKAESLDPLSLIISADLADALCIARRYDDSVQQSRKTLEMDPNFAVAHYELGQTYTQQHLGDQAVAEFRRAIELSGSNPTFESNLGYAFAVSGRREEATKIVENLEEQLKRHSGIEANIALIYVGLGDNEQAMVWLNKARQARFNPSILLRPAFEPLWADSRFQDLLRAMGIPQPARILAKPPI
jgi:TolB-like protein/DNA-binding winged helix-turn-helix (wHTH) protein/Flp pilus assembly protein TadD